MEPQWIEKYTAVSQSISICPWTVPFVGRPMKALRGTIDMLYALHILLLCVAILACSAESLSAPGGAKQTGGDIGFEYIDTSFENASPIWYETAADGAIQLHLLYDNERASPNRAAGHFHFQIHARPGSTVTIEFKNLDNVWNSQPGSVAREL